MSEKDGGPESYSAIHLKESVYSLHTKSVPFHNSFLCISKLPSQPCFSNIFFYYFHKITLILFIALLGLKLRAWKNFTYLYCNFVWQDNSVQYSSCMTSCTYVYHSLVEIPQ